MIATSMIGLKFKLAHKRASKDTWNISDKAKHKALIGILKSMIKELERDPEKLVPVPLAFQYKGKEYKGTGIPVISSCKDGVCQQLDITLNKKHLGVIKCTKNGWHITDVPQGLTKVIGNQLLQWYE